MRDWPRSSAITRPTADELGTCTGGVDGCGRVSHRFDGYGRRDRVGARNPEPKRYEMARGNGGFTGGIGLGGILVIVGIVLMIVASFWIGLIVLLVGLVAFGGFSKGKWY
jgi:hypothetical protein